LKPDVREQLLKRPLLQIRNPETQSISKMSTKLFVGNLSFNTTENDLQDLFASYGPVQQVDMIMDRMTGRPRGFGFVTMENNEDAQKAIEGLHGKPFGGRDLTVNEARPREDRPQGAGRSFGGGGGGGGGYGGGHVGGGGGGRDRGDRGDRGNRREGGRDRY
jgi:cold-inducible RNA-binding protein